MRKEGIFYFGVMTRQFVEMMGSSRQERESRWKFSEARKMHDTARLQSALRMGQILLSIYCVSTKFTSYTCVHPVGRPQNGGHKMAAIKVAAIKWLPQKDR